MKTLHYIVGEHALSISFADEANDERLIPSFSRFRVDALSQAPLFCVLVDDAFRWGSLVARLVSLTVLATTMAFTRRPRVAISLPSATRTACFAVTCRRTPTSEKSPWR